MEQDLRRIHDRVVSRRAVMAGAGVSLLALLLPGCAREDTPIVPGDGGEEGGEDEGGEEGGEEEGEDEGGEEEGGEEEDDGGY